jgi:hypothetical protein
MANLATAAEGWLHAVIADLMAEIARLKNAEEAMKKELAAALSKPTAAPPPPPPEPPA